MCLKQGSFVRVTPVMATGGHNPHSPRAPAGHYDVMVDSPDCEDILDPRVKTELETLNLTASDVNRLEKEIDSAREKYQLTFQESSHQLEQLKKKIEGSIRKARPYYELKELSKEAQNEALRSARKFQAANGVYLAAKETIALAELRLMDDKAVSLSAAWQEMLNHALFRVTDAESERTKAQKEHLKLSANFANLELKLHDLEKKHKKSIAKARLYFETKMELDLKLQQLKQTIEDLQQAMRSSKRRYSSALRHLESISNGIHEQRRHKLLMMIPREPGVGAEDNEDEVVLRGRLPSLASSTLTEDSHSPTELEESVLALEEELDAIDEEFLGYQDIQNESVFRAKVLNTALDDDDTSFISRGAFRQKRLHRARSLPMNIHQASKLEYTFKKGAGSDKNFRDLPDDVLRGTDGSLNWDRNENSPPDGDSLNQEQQEEGASRVEDTTLQVGLQEKNDGTVVQNPHVEASSIIKSSPRDKGISIKAPISSQEENHTEKCAKSQEHQ